MLINEAKRYRLWSRLEEKLGVEEAATLMTLLPRRAEEHGSDNHPGSRIESSSRVDPPGMTAEQLQQAIKDDMWFAIKIFAIANAYLIWILVVVRALAR